MSKHLTFWTFAVAALAAALPSSARADVLVLCQNISGGVMGVGSSLGCTQQQGNSLTDENVLFSDPAAVTSGSTVTGVTQSSNTLFNFFSSTDSLLVNNANGGNATISSTTDSFIDSLKYFVSPTQTYGSTLNAFTVLDTNLDVQNSAGTVSFLIHALTSGGQAEVFSTLDFALTNGANNFSFVASNGEVITDITYLATSGVTSVLVEDVKQTSVTLAVAPGGGPGPSDIPEPATILVLGAGLLGLGALRRRS